MALSMFLRSATRGNLPNLLRSQLAFAKQTVGFHQLTKAPAQFSLVKNAANLKNNVAVVPKRFASGDHSKHWSIDRILALVLLGALPYTIISPCKVVDNLAAIAIVVHSHMGFESMVVDYLRPIIVGPVVPKIGLVVVYILSAATLGGLLYFNYADVGIGQGIRNLWTLKSKQ